MDKREAIELLRAYRPGMNGEMDARMVEAVKFARQDPELAQWLEGHCLLHATMRAKLREIPVPENLKAQILSRAATAQAAPEQNEKIIPLRPSAWKIFVPLAAAAAIALLAGGLWIFLGANKDKFADFREREVKLPQRGYAMTIHSSNLTEIHSFLLSKQCPDYNLPKPLAKMDALGCATLDWRDRKVSMVCLKTATNKNVYLFVMNAANLADTPPPGTREFSQVLHLMSASWTDGGKVYILAAPVSETDIKSLLD